MHLPLCIFDLAGRLPPWPSSLACCAFRANLRPAQPGACDGRGGQGHVMLMVNMGGGMESPRTEAGSAGASCFGHAMRGEGGGREREDEKNGQSLTLADGTHSSLEPPSDLPFPPKFPSLPEESSSSSSSSSSVPLSSCGATRLYRFSGSRFHCRLHSVIQSSRTMVPPFPTHRGQSQQ